MSVVKDFLELAKARIGVFVCLTAGAGFVLGSPGRVAWTVLLWTVLGTGLAAAAAGALNQVLEIDADALMRRTKNRPLPAGRMRAERALAFGVACALAGCLILQQRVNWLSASLTAFTLVAYLLVYTPLKRTTPLSTWAGAVPGAMPPLIGWAAAAGGLSVEAALLFAIQYFWQLPHFLALSWMYRKDYARAGFRVASVVEPDGRSVSRQMVFSSAALLVLSAASYLAGLGGIVALAGTIVAGAFFLNEARRAAVSLSDASARRVFLASLAYLPAVLLVLVVCR